MLPGLDAIPFLQSLRKFLAGEKSLVHTTGDETIGGTKTFTTRPVVGTAALATSDTGAASTAFANAAAVAAAGTVHSEQYVYIRDEKPASTAGGAFTSGAWRTRVLNTEVIDTGNNAAIATNQITLIAGTYRFKASCPAYTVNDHQMKLRNVTDGIDYLGSSEHANETTFGQSRSTVSGRFTIAASKAFELQHYCAITGSFGKGVSFGVSSFSEVEFWREF